MCTPKKIATTGLNCLKPHSRAAMFYSENKAKKVQLLVGKHKVENDKLTTFIVMKAVTEFNHLKKCLYSSVTTTGNVLSHFPLLLFYLLQCCPSLLYCENINWVSLLITMHFKNLFITPVLFPISMTYILKCPTGINHFFLFHVITLTCCQLGCFPHLGFKYLPKGFCSCKPYNHYRNIKNDFGSGMWFTAKHYNVVISSGKLHTSGAISVKNYGKL